MSYIHAGSGVHLICDENRGINGNLTVKNITLRCLKRGILEPTNTYCAKSINTIIIVFIEDKKRNYCSTVVLVVVVAVVAVVAVKAVVALVAVVEVVGSRRSGSGSK